MTELQLSLVGCGGMGLRHAHGYVELRRQSDSFRLAAVCDLHESAANHLASVVESATGHRPKVYTDLNAMLERERGLDAIDIVTDTRMHHGFAKSAFQAGLHVFTEKPMGLTMRACQEMRSAAERAGRVLSIGEQYRRDPMNRLTRALIDEGVIGTPYYAMKVGLSGGSGLMHNTGWRALKSRAGSIIIEQGVHEADLMLYFMGDAESVFAQTGLFTKTRRREGMNPRLAAFYGHRVEDVAAGAETMQIDQEDTAFGVVKFASGAIGQLTISNASHGHSAGMNSVHGSRGTVLLPPSRTGKSPQVMLEGRDGPLSGDEMLAAVPDWELDDFTAPFWDGKRRMASYEMTFEEVDRKLVAVELKEFADCIRTGRTPEVDALMAMKDLAIPYAMLESGLIGQPVSIADVLEGEVDAYQREINEGAGLA